MSRCAWLLLLLAGAAHAQVPTAPTNLAATAVSTTQINLSWTDTSNNETSFKIERKTNTTAFAQIATVGANVHTFSNTALTSATTYTYRVRASNASGNSAYTNEASATTQGSDTTAPSTPGGLNATPTSPNQINLTWNASTDAVGVTGYRVERCQGVNCTTFAQIATPATTSFSDTGRTASTAYRYRVRAADAAGNLSSYSSIASATSSSVGPVGAWGLNGVIGTTQADYSGNNNRGTPVTGIDFDPLMPTTAGQFGRALVFGGPNVGVDLGNPGVLNAKGSITISAWIYSTAFPIDDAAIVSKFNGSFQGYQLDTTVDTGPRVVGFKLAGPGGALMARYGATVLQLNQWYHVAGVYDAGTQTMTVYLNGVPDNGTLVGPVSATPVSAPQNANIGRRPDDPVKFNFQGTIDEARIYDRALTQAEIQADMNAAIAASDAVAPSAPTNLALSAMSATQLHVQWTNSSDNFDVTGYRVERCQGVGCSAFAEIASVADFRFEDTGLAPATSYSYRVRATDGAGNFSAYTSVASNPTPATNPVGGRVGVYPFDEGGGTTTADFSGLGNSGTLNVSVGWTAAGKNGNALSFTSGYVDLGNPGALQLTGSMTLSAWIYSTAFPGNDAAIVSKLVLSPGPGWQLDTTVDTGPRVVGFKLANPSGALMARYGATTLQLNQWYHVAGVYDAQAQTLNVYLNGQLDNGTLVGTVTPTQLDALINVFIGKRPGLNGYEFNGTIDDVRIYNRALSQTEIQADMSVPASTPPGDTTPPTAPSGLTATAAGAGQINLNWTASTDNVGVTGYGLERCQGAGCSNFTQITAPITASFSDTGLVAATSYSYRVRASDAAGNLSAYSNVASATVSVASPVIFGQTPKDVTLPGGSTPQVGAAYIAQAGTEIDVASVSIVLDGANITQQATVTASGVLYLVAQPLANVTHTVAVSVASVGGSVATETWSFAIDDPAPNFYSETPRDVFVADHNPRIRVLLSGFQVGVASVRLILDGSDVTAQADTGVDHIIFTPVAPLADGVHTVNVSATDGRGASGSKEWQFTVQTPSGPATTDDGVRTERTFVPTVRGLP